MKLLEWVEDEVEWRDDVVAGHEIQDKVVHTNVLIVPELRCQLLWGAG